MKYLLILLSLVSTLCVPSGYHLVWSDEFDGNSIDRNKWGYDIGGSGWGNNELEYYTDRSDNAYVSNSIPRINSMSNMDMLKLELLFHLVWEYGQLSGC